MKLRIMSPIMVLLALSALIASAGEMPPRRRTLPPELITPDGSTMIWVPGCLFEIGDDNGPEDSRPRHETVVPTFYIDRYEVTNERYLKFCRETGHEYPAHLKKSKITERIKNLPVVNVTYGDADAYARWARKQLPTEEEWELAARGRKGNIYPWGNRFKPLAAIRRKTPLPVGSKKGDVGPHGVFDMAGNVMEWTRSYYKSYPGAEKRFKKKYNHRVVRGAHYKTRDAEQCRLFVRKVFAKSTRSPLIGFRCVREIKYR